MGPEQSSLAKLVEKPMVTKPSSNKKISIITPCYNEEENISTCAAEVRNIMENQLIDKDIS